jgi:RimJ/RimL family protein N-acetyltransferase
MADDSVLLKTVLFDGQVAGSVVSFILGGEREVGYWIGKKFWSKGIATQALAEFLNHIKTRPLYAHVAKHNIASRRVLEKCGFTVIGENKDFSIWDGKKVEGFILKLEA